MVTSDLLHALRNPVAAFKTSLELLVGGTVDAEDLPQLHRVLRNELGKLTDLLGRCSELTRLTGLAMGSADLASIVRASVEGHTSACAQQHVRVEYRAGEAGAIPMRGDAALFERDRGCPGGQCDRSDAGRRRHVDGERVARTAHRMAELRVVDTGAGISPTVLPNVFRLFYDDEEGCGVECGLPVARQIFTAHGGRIEIVSSEGQGTGSDGAGSGRRRRRTARPRRRGGLGIYASGRQVARHAMPGAQLDELGRAHVAEPLLGDGASRVKRAAGGRVHRARNVSLEHDALALLAGIGDGNGAKQRLGVRVLRLFVEVFGRCLFDYQAQVHHRDALREILHDLQVMGDEEKRQL